MVKSLTTEEFIIRAKEKHGEKFDYSKVVFKSMVSKVVIVDRETGQEFQISPTMHLKYSGKPKMNEGVITRTCPLCNMKMTTPSKDDLSGFHKHIEEYHVGYFLVNTDLKSSIAIAKKELWCPVTNKWYSDLKWLAREIHTAGWSSEQYYLTYGKEFLPSIVESNMNDPMLGDARNHNKCLHCGKEVQFNESKWEYPAFCCFSCSTTWYAQNTDRPQRAMQTLQKRQQDDPNLGLRNTQPQYWLNKGFTEAEAKEKIRERQQTFTLEKCIEKYGEEDGIIKFLERQEQWKKSLSQSGLYTGFSSVSKKLFEAVEKVIPDIRHSENEKSIFVGSKYIWVDCVHEATKKIIEFYGDYWHGNPNRFKPTDVLKWNKSLTVQDKWNRDAERITLLKNAGYKVLVIWESEYYDNPDIVLGKCIGFLS